MFHWPFSKVRLRRIDVCKYTPDRHNQGQCIVSFYCSESDKPLDVTDAGVRKIGTFLRLSLSLCVRSIDGKRFFSFGICSTMVSRQSIIRTHWQWIRINDVRFKREWSLVIPKSKWAPSTWPTANVFGQLLICWTNNNHLLLLVCHYISREISILRRESLSGHLSLPFDLHSNIDQ